MPYVMSKSTGTQDSTEYGQHHDGSSSKSNRDRTGPTCTTPTYTNDLTCPDEPTHPRARGMRKTAMSRVQSRSSTPERLDLHGQTGCTFGHICGPTSVHGIHQVPHPETQSLTSGISPATTTKSNSTTAHPTNLEVERAWVWAQSSTSPVFKNLKVGSSLKFPAFIEGKLGLKVGLMVFIKGLGPFRLDP